MPGHEWQITPGKISCVTCGCERVYDKDKDCYTFWISGFTTGTAEPDCEEVQSALSKIATDRRVK